VSRDVIEMDPAGPIWEVPIYSRPGRRFQQFTVRRLRAKFSKNIPKAQKQDMVQKLGIGKNPVKILKFLAQPIPIKLDYHNQPPHTLVNWIKSAPAAMKGGLDVVVLIGPHEGAHGRCRVRKVFGAGESRAGFEVFRFWRSWRIVAAQIERTQGNGAGAFAGELIHSSMESSTATAPVQVSATRVRDGRTQARDAGMNPIVSEGIQRFETWLDKNGLKVLIPTMCGARSTAFLRGGLLRKGVVGLPLIAPILLMEAVCRPRAGGSCARTGSARRMGN